MDEQEQMSFFYEIFDASLPRLGPGDDASTARALEVVLGTDGTRGHAGMRILDLGCGNGAQTVALAKHMDCNILAVDNHQAYLDELGRRAVAGGVSERIRVMLADMRDIGSDLGPFDLVWSEGALYIMGFRDGLEACGQLMVSGGSLAVTEICWFSDDAPDECRRFFAEEYPAMVDVKANLAAIDECGYDVLSHFALPESAWLESYYHPLEERLVAFRESCASDPERLEVVEWVQSEIDIFRRHSKYYGYEFFIMRRR